MVIVFTIDNQQAPRANSSVLNNDPNQYLQQKVQQCQLSFQNDESRLIYVPLECRKSS